MKNSFKQDLKYILKINLNKIKNPNIICGNHFNKLINVFYNSYVSLVNHFFLRPI